VRVGLLQPLDELAERVRAALKEQVIRHQAVGVDPGVELGAAVSQTVSDPSPFDNSR
jgi:hypothetical protein